MTVGTRSILFGVHNPLIHSWFIALAWRRLFGMPWDPRLWAAFITHDLGYWGRRDMDGREEGERHPELGAKIMGALFGPEWGDFVLFHSRYYAKMHGRPVSRLCIADKAAICYTPDWLYLVLANLSGEVAEYMTRAAGEGKYGGQHVDVTSQRAWLRSVKCFCAAWVEAHRDGSEDTWTPDRGRAA